MTIVENQNGKFFIPGEIANDPNKTVAEIQANAIPYDLYLAQQRVEDIQNELQELQDAPDEISVPNPEKERTPDVEQQLNEAQATLKNLMSKYGTNN